jgi:hypothetical protein
MEEFTRMTRLPPYVFATVNQAGDKRIKKRHVALVRLHTSD